MSHPNNSGSGDADLSTNAVSGAGLQVVGGLGTVGPSESYTPNANTTVVGSSFVSHRPLEELAVLSKMELQVLLDGDIAGARAGRDLCLGISASGVIGLIGLLATTDWGDVFTKGKWGPAVWAGLMFAIVLASAVGAAIYGVRQHKVAHDSAYSSLISRLQKHFGINPK